MTGSYHSGALVIMINRTVEKSALGKALGHERMFFNLEQAVEAYQALYEAGEG